MTLHNREEDEFLDEVRDLAMRFGKAADGKDQAVVEGALGAMMASVIGQQTDGELQATVAMIEGFANLVLQLVQNAPKSDGTVNGPRTLQ